MDRRLQFQLKPYFDRYPRWRAFYSFFGIPAKKGWDPIETSLEIREPLPAEPKCMEQREINQIMRKGMSFIEKETIKKRSVASWNGFFKEQGMAL